MIETLDIQAQLQERWMIFWWALGIGLVALGIGIRQGLFKSIQRHATPFIRGIDVLRGFGLFLLAELLIIPLFFGLIFQAGGWDVNVDALAKAALHLLMIIGGFLAVLLAFSGLKPAQKEQLMGKATPPWTHHVKIGVAACLVSFPLVLAFTQIVSIIVWAIFHHPFIDQAVVQDLKDMLANRSLFFTFALAIVTIIPFTEEYLFRGLLQSWLKRKFHRTPVAIAGSSLVFALFHYSSLQGITNIELLTSLFLLSCVLGYIYERQRSLWAPIGMHAFYNLMSVFVILMGWI